MGRRRGPRGTAHPAGVRRYRVSALRGHESPLSDVDLAHQQIRYSGRERVRPVTFGDKTATALDQVPPVLERERPERLAGHEGSYGSVDRVACPPVGSPTCCTACATTPKSPASTGISSVIRSPINGSPKVGTKVTSCRWPVGNRGRCWIYAKSAQVERAHNAVADVARRQGATPASPLEVVIDCPDCRATIAASVLSGGRLSVEHRQADMEDRPDHPRGAVLTRPWVRSELALTDTEARFNVWPCTCSKVRCGGRLILDSVRGPSGHRSGPRRGQLYPLASYAAAVERSEALRPYTEGSYWNERLTERGRAAQRERLSAPSPLAEASIRARTRST